MAANRKTKRLIPVDFLLALFIALAGSIVRIIELLAENRSATVIDLPEILSGGAIFVLSILGSLWLFASRNSESRNSARPRQYQVSRALQQIGFGVRSGLQYALRLPVIRTFCSIGLFCFGLYAFHGTEMWYEGHSWFCGPRIRLVSTTEHQMSRMPGAVICGRIGGSKQPPTPVVFNLPWQKYGHDFGSTAWGWNGVSEPAHRKKLEGQFRDLAKSEVDAVVWFLFGDGRASPEWNEHGEPMFLDNHFLADYDAAVQLARDYDIGIVWVLIDYKAFEPARSVDGVTLGGHSDVVADPSKRTRFIERVLKPLVARYPSERSIVGWILVNEPEIAINEGHVTRDAMMAFIGQAAATVHQLAQNQPVSVGHTDLESLVDFASVRIGMVDFLTFHHYDSVFPPSVEHVRRIIDRNSRVDKREASGISDRGIAASVTQYPIYIGEYNSAMPPFGDDWPKWAWAAGYDGFWPWSLNDASPPNDDANFWNAKTTQERPTDRLNIWRWANLIRTRTDASFKTKFDRRYRGSLSEKELSFWHDYAIKAVDNLKIRRAKLLQEANSHDATWKENMGLAREAKNIVTEQQEFLKEVQIGIIKTKEDIQKNREWIKRIEDEFIDIEERIKNAENSLSQIRERMKRHRLPKNEITELRQWMNREIEHSRKAQKDRDRNREEFPKARAALTKSQAALTDKKRDQANQEREIAKQSELINQYMSMANLHGKLKVQKTHRANQTKDLYIDFWQRELELKPEH